jgi:hypothetical protein
MSMIFHRDPAVAATAFTIAILLINNGLVGAHLHFRDYRRDNVILAIVGIRPIKYSGGNPREYGSQSPGIAPTGP